MDGMAAEDNLNPQQFNLPTTAVRFLGLPINEYSGERGTEKYQASLTADIKEHGIRTPLQVKRVHDWSSLAGEENYKGPATHIIRDGAHRLDAANRLGLSHVPAEEV